MGLFEGNSDAPFAIAIHGGAGQDSEFIRKNLSSYEKSLERICKAGYEMLEKKAQGLDVIFEVLKMLEDDPLFNAGRGSCLNENGEAVMDAAAMEGKGMRTGSACLINQIRNPSMLIKEILKETNHCFIGGEGAIELAREKKLQLEPDSYFIIEHQVDVFMEKRGNKALQERLKPRTSDTTGVVVLDVHGSVFTGVSTGGTENCIKGRIGDSSSIGCGIYANDKTCAVCSTGDGEYIIQGVIAHTVATYMEFTGAGIVDACHYVIHERNKGIQGDIGVIGVDTKGNIGIAFNSPRMHRAWASKGQPIQVKIYK